MVDVGSFSLVHLPSSAPCFSLNHAQQADNEPLPSIEGCGLNYQHSSGLDMQPQPHCPSPFQRDVGGSFLLDEGFGQGEWVGGTGESLGGTHEVHPKNKPWQMSWFIFPFFAHSIPLTVVPRATTPDDPANSHPGAPKSAYRVSKYLLPRMHICLGRITWHLRRFDKDEADSTMMKRIWQAGGLDNKQEDSTMSRRIRWQAEGFDDKQQGLMMSSRVWWWAGGFDNEQQGLTMNSRVWQWAGGFDDEQEGFTMMTSWWSGFDHSEPDSTTTTMMMMKQIQGRQSGFQHNEAYSCHSG